MLIHDSYPDVLLFHSPLRGDFPSRWLQLLQWLLVSPLRVPDRVEESLCQAKPSHAKPSQAKPSQAKPSQAKRNGAKRSETKRNEAKRNEAKRNEAKRSETKRSETKRNEAKRSETKRSEAKFTVPHSSLCCTFHNAAHFPSRCFLGKTLHNIGRTSRPSLYFICTLTSSNKARLLMI